MSVNANPVSPVKNDYVVVLARDLDRNTVRTLEQAKSRGLDVRVVLSDAIDQTADTFTNRPTIAQLTRAGADVSVLPAKVVEGALAACGGASVRSLIVVGANAALGGGAPTVLAQLRSGSVEPALPAHARHLEAVVRQVSAGAVSPRAFASTTLARADIVPPPAAATKLADCVFVVFDLETTGLDARSDDRLLSFSAQAVRLRPDGSLERLASTDLYVQPGEDALARSFNIPAEARRVNGLTHDELERLGAKPLSAALPEIVAFFRAAQAHGPVVVAGQNICGFDVGFLNACLGRMDLETGYGADEQRPALVGPFVDTRLLAQKVLANEPPMAPHPKTGVPTPSWRLDAFIEYFGLPKRGVHTAQEDTELTAEVLVRLIARSGATTLGEISSSGPVTDQRDVKPRPSYRTTVDINEHHVAITRFPLVRDIEDAVARRDALFVRNLDHIEGGVPEPMKRTALAVLRENGYVWDAELLERHILMAQPAPQAQP